MVDHKNNVCCKKFVCGTAKIVMTNHTNFMWIYLLTSTKNPCENCERLHRQLTVTLHYICGSHYRECDLCKIFNVH